jgi:hypothetical protein
MAAGYWLRLWTETPNDPKFRSIAKLSGQHITVVLSVFMHMLCCAKNSSIQGTLVGWVDDDIAAALDLDPDQVAAIRTAMQGKILDGDVMRNWEKRQPNRDDDSRDRVAKHRAKEKPVTQCNAPVTDVTQGNAPETETETEKELETTTPLTPQPDEKKETVAVVVKLLTESICPILNQIEADMVHEWVASVPRDWITAAVKQAALQKARSIKYVDTIMRAWRSKYKPEEKPWEVEADGKDRKTRLSRRDRTVPTENDWAAARSRGGW